MDTVEILWAIVLLCCAGMIVSVAAWMVYVVCLRRP